MLYNFIDSQERFASLYSELTGREIVEHAHMELAEPSIKDGFDACVRRGATRVIVSPFFLSPGRHWRDDVPTLVAEAAAPHPGVEFIITAPLGAHPLLVTVLEERAERCNTYLSGLSPACDVCRGTGQGCEKVKMNQVSDDTTDS